MPCHDEVPGRALVAEVLAHVHGLTIVDDGSEEPLALELEALATEIGAALVRMPARGGKGAALRAGLESVLRRRPRPSAVLTIDADGQHPASAIPKFLAAGSTAELVIGDRLGDLAAMPWRRRVGNLSSRRLLELATGRDVRDTQCGMRLLRGGALELPFEGDGYEAETRHLKASLERGLEVAWVPIPAIYGDETSSFRTVRDTCRILVALVRPSAAASRSPTRSQRRTGFPPARPTSSAPRDRPVTELPEPQRQGAVP
jgi:glycosyltransferase involved in cell wall biosynthesis